MNSSRLRLPTWLAATLVVLSLMGCDQFKKDTALDKTASLPTMRTVCVGRYLIDMPAEFQQTPGGDVELTYGLDKNFRTVKVQVSRFEGTQPSFDAIVQQRVKELSGDEHLESPSKTMLATTRQLDSKTALVRAYDDHRLTNIFKSQWFVEKDASVGLFEADIFKRDRPEDIEDRTLKVVRQSTFAATPDQAGKGACMGPLVIDAGQDGESFTVAFRAKRWPDVVIGLSINSLVAESDGGLLKRWDQGSVKISRQDLHASTVRRGKTVFGGQAAEELLIRDKDQGRTTRVFIAETMLTKPATFAAPLTAIRMEMGGQVDSGEYVDASWSDSEAVTIWDAIVKSIRLRPGAL